MRDVHDDDYNPDTTVWPEIKARVKPVHEFRVDLSRPFDELLNDYFKAGQLEDVDCYRLSEANKKAIKQAQIAELNWVIGTPGDAKYYSAIAERLATLEGKE